MTAARDVSVRPLMADCLHRSEVPERQLSDTSPTLRVVVPNAPDESQADRRCLVRLGWKGRQCEASAGGATMATSLKRP